MHPPVPGRRANTKLSPSFLEIAHARLGLDPDRDGRVPQRRVRQLVHAHGHRHARHGLPDRLRQRRVRLPLSPGPTVLLTREARVYKQRQDKVESLRVNRLAAASVPPSAGFYGGRNGGAMDA